MLIYLVLLFYVVSSSYYRFSFDIIFCRPLQLLELKVFLICTSRARGDMVVGVKAPIKKWLLHRQRIRIQFQMILHCQILLQKGICCAFLISI